MKVNKRKKWANRVQFAWSLGQITDLKNQVWCLLCVDDAPREMEQEEGTEGRKSLLKGIKVALALSLSTLLVSSNLIPLYSLYWDFGVGLQDPTGNL
ncbi:hypothetical protein L6164_030912 [Bauhinia variegata]|uniref:Uncharacterized protein n=1 Tax=Bauhinia variegata TaxID=167791 RepID=A0ACB9LE65_BAUVA|nr:hypothetical protein L6164_030912 [Bauhinia variegata]